MTDKDFDKSVVIETAQAEQKYWRGYIADLASQISKIEEKIKMAQRELLAAEDKEAEARNT